jgi:dienelactone hydrolase
MKARIRTWSLLLAAWLCAGMVGTTAAKAVEIVHFESATYPPTPYQTRQALQQGRKPEPLPGLPLKGRLSKPDGEGPFPAVVLMHGCGGIWRWNDVWSDRLAGWGFVVLDVDSFGPRGKTSICENGGSITGEMRALDAYGAKTFLAGAPFVDPTRIALIGMSHGGWAVLNAARRATFSDLELKPFQAAIALYPWCDDPTEVGMPLLIMTGEADDWSPVERCRTFVAGAGSSSKVVLKVYPGAHHLFDLKGIDERQDGHVLRYDPQAADDAEKQIAAFLAKHL